MIDNLCVNIRVRTIFQSSCADLVTIHMVIQNWQLDASTPIEQTTHAASASNVTRGITTTRKFKKIRTKIEKHLKVVNTDAQLDQN